MRHMSMWCGLVLATSVMLVAACGDDPCPAGTVDMGGRCAPIDGGAQADGATPDAGSDAAADTDASTDAGGVDSCVPAAESCDGIDNDCDGTVDEGFAAIAEMCDGVDQDCDGAVDEGLVGPRGAAIRVDAANARGVDVSGYASGYVVVWVDRTNVAYWQRRDSFGGALAPRAAVDFPAVMGTVQSKPAVEVVDSPAGPRALVAWEQENGLLVRALPLDGTPPPPAVEIAPMTSPKDTSPEVLVVDGRAVVLWQDEGTPGRGHAQQVSAETGAAIGPSLEVFRYETFGIILGARLPVAAVDGADPFLLVGYTEQRPGDLVETGYVQRVAVGAMGLRVDGSPLRLQPAADRNVGVAHPMAIGGARDGEPPAAVGVYELNAGVELLSTVDVAPSATGTPLTMLAGFDAVDPPGLVLDASPVAGGASMLYLTTLALGGTAVSLQLGQVAGARSEGAAPQLIRTYSSFAGAGLARRGANEGAIAFVDPDAAGGGDVVLQLLGCE